MKKLHVLLFVFTTLLILSCGSDDGNSSENDNSETTELSTEEKLAFKWQLEVFSINEGSNSVDECSQNDTIEFFSNGNYEELNNYGTPCVSELSSGTWEFTNGFLFTITGGEKKYEILQLDSTILQIETISEFTTTQGDTVTNTLTFTYEKV